MCVIPGAIGLQLRSNVCAIAKIQSLWNEIVSARIGHSAMSSATPSQEPDSTVCFANRWEAGERLARAIVQAAADDLAHNQPFVVYALPRGGLPVATPIARQLQCPLDIIVAKKITRLENTELAIGAVTADGHAVWLAQARSPIEPSKVFANALQRAQEKAQAQLEQLSQNRPNRSPEGAIALIVDDGIATGMTMSAAVQALRTQAPAQIWICVPVAPPELLPQLKTWGDRVIVLATPQPFNSVSRFYQEFTQVEMDEAIACLRWGNTDSE